MQSLLIPFTPIINFSARYLRGVSMFIIVLPLSKLYRTYNRLFNSWLSIIRFIQHPLTQPNVTAIHRHQQRVNRVQQQVQKRALDPIAKNKPMCTARQPWANLSTRLADYKASSHVIYVGDLKEIIEVDVKNQTVRVEPLASVGEITEYLVPLGFMMQTTLEIKEATIGGLAMAVGMTTASHKFGLLQETVVEYEVILGDGEIVRVRDDDPKTRDLFHAIPWSHGSLCLLVGITLRLTPVTPWVRIEYIPFHSQSEFCTEFRVASWDDSPITGSDFVEATVFSKENAVLMKAKFVQKKDYPNLSVNDVGWWWKEWFYKRIERVATQHQPEYELIPTMSYIFRHDKATFWTLRDQLNENIGNHPLFRFLFGWLYPPQVSFLKLPAFTAQLRHEMRTQRVYQDIVLPADSLEKAIDLGFDTFGISPILVYPSLVTDYGEGLRGTFPTRAVERNLIPKHRNKKDYPKSALFYDLGIYGIPQAIREGKPFDGVHLARKMENFTTEQGGAPFLYAQTFFTKEEFESTFDLTLYRLARKKWKAEGAFVDLFTKVGSDKKS
jgi:delta24-sterol reductase